MPTFRPYSTSKKSKPNTFQYCGVVGRSLRVYEIGGCLKGYGVGQRSGAWDGLPRAVDLQKGWDGNHFSSVPIPRPGDPTAIQVYLRIYHKVKPISYIIPIMD